MATEKTSNTLTSAEKTIELWKNTDYTSDIYNEMHQLRNCIKNSGKYRKEYQIKNLLEESWKKDKIDDFLLYLNEYELLFGTDSEEYRRYENLAVPKYRELLISANRPNCKYIDEGIFNSKYITDFKDLHKGERCFIIGNGPSLNKLDLTKLKNEITFGVNSIFLNYEKMGFNPTYYTVEDSHVIKERAEAIKNISGSIKFIPQYAYKIFGDRNDFIYINTILDYRRYKGFPYFSTDISRRAWVGGTVSYINLQLAYYMGFKEIYLIGFDHNYIIPQSANVSGANILSTADDPNHFHPDYFGKGFSWHVPLTERMELCYLKSKYAFEQSGKKIINATAGGHLEVFPRADFETVLSAKRIVNLHSIPSEKETKPFDITVVIPAYNSEDTLARAVESVLNQKNIYPEILIINDGSSDHTYDIAQEYAESFKNIKIISQENMGLGGARNTGIAHATTPYITFLDADDTLINNILSIALTKQKEEGYDIVQFDYARIDYTGKDIKKAGAGATTSCGIDGILDIASTKPFSAWARIYKKDLLTTNNIYFPPKMYHEDIVFTLKAYFYSKKVGYINKKGYNWIMREGSITSHITQEHIDAMKTNILQFKQFLKENSLFELAYRRYLVFSYRLLTLLIGRIYTMKDIYERTNLLRYLRHTIEELNLDFYEAIQVAASNRKDQVLPLFEKLFYYREAIKQSPSAKAQTTTAKTPCKSSAGIISKIFRIFIVKETKRKKFDRNPYQFFEDAKPPFTALKHLFKKD